MRINEEAFTSAARLFYFSEPADLSKIRSGFRLGEPVGALLQQFERLGGGYIWDRRRHKVSAIMNPQVSDLNTFGLLDGKEMDHRQDVRESRTTRFSCAGA